MQNDFNIGSDITPKYIIPSIPIDTYVKEQDEFKSLSSQYDWGI